MWRLEGTIYWIAWEDSGLIRLLTVKRSSACEAMALSSGEKRRSEGSSLVKSELRMPKSERNPKAEGRRSILLRQKHYGGQGVGGELEQHKVRTPRSL